MQVHHHCQEDPFLKYASFGEEEEKERPLIVFTTAISE